MLPTVDEALYELKLAEELNPGPWVRHSVNTGIAARNIAEKVSWLNPEKAYIVGLLHDIGRRVGVVDIPTHVYEGYKYCMENGWDGFIYGIPAKEAAQTILEYAEAHLG